MVQNHSQAQFFSDDSPESDEARRLLVENQVPFNEWKKGRDFEPAEDFTLPAIQGRYGDLRGLKGVRAYIRLFKNDPRSSKP